jgi:hypothetical protein
MIRNPFRAIVALIGVLSPAVLAQQPQQPPPPPAPPAAAGPADGITMAMMPITQEQLAGCRAQASDQLAKEQETLGKREGKQDTNKMKQGGITAVAGAATTAIGRRGGWWGGNHSGDATAGATAGTQRTERNSDNVASTTATSQVTGNKAYDDCIDGIKGPEYVYFRATGRLPAPGQIVSTVGQPPAVSPPAPVRKDPYTALDEKTGILELPEAEGKSVGVEVTKIGANLYRDKAGNKYLVRDDKSILKIPTAEKEQRR